MKHFIAHRGNLTGANVERENSPDYIIEAIDAGFDCEVDVRRIEGVLYLGHDSPRYIIELEWLLQNAHKLWIHCKNFQALNYLKRFSSLNVFYHQNDDFVLTSKNNIWSYPFSEKTSKHTITVMPEWNHWKTYNKSLGVCSDYVAYIKDSYFHTRGV
jgi:sulfite reductase alpha subunit-like flavoprotein